MEALDRMTSTVGKGLNMAVSCIDANLVELNECVNHCHHECETNEAVLELCKACLEELERLFNAQSIHMVKLEPKMDSVACHWVFQQGQGERRG